MDTRPAPQRRRDGTWASQRNHWNAEGQSSAHPELAFAEVALERWEAYIGLRGSGLVRYGHIRVIQILSTFGGLAARPRSRQDAKCLAMRGGRFAL